MFNRKEIKAKGKAAFKANYWPAVVGGLVLGVAESGGGSAGGSSNASTNQQIADGVSQMDPALIILIIGVILFAIIVAVALKVFVLNPLAIGGYKFFIENRTEKAELNLLGYGFKHNYMGTVKTMFLRDLYTGLWTLLFIIPGIVKAYEYRMIPMLLAENPELTSKEAFEQTKAMMTGNKGAAFVLDLSFFGWGILSLLTLGILAVFYVQPYIYATEAELYAALAGKDDDVMYEAMPEY